MSENEKESQEITYALDIPSKRDYSFDEFFIDTDEDEIK